MKSGMCVAWAVCAGSLLLPLAAQKTAPPKAQNSGSHHVQKSETAGTDRGEQVFKQNCTRCHEAPQNFSAQITGTIVRHMRVRASLSAADEKALLHYLNPQ